MQPRSARSRALPLLGALVLACLTAACQSHQRRIERFCEAWSRADFARAEDELDHAIAQEAKVPVEEVVQSHGLSDAIDPAKGDTGLFLLEKSMTRLAAGDLGSAIDLLRRARDLLEERRRATDVAGFFQAALSDDESMDFVGADYEHVLVPTLLALIDLLEGGQDAYAYALQIGEVQEQILGSDFGEDVPAGPPPEKGAAPPTVSYNPRERYDRVAIGAYVEGLLREEEGYGGEARKAYERAKAWGADVPVVERALARTAGELRPEPGTGTLHVFYLAGLGPRLVEGRAELTELALTLAYAGSFLVGNNVGLIGQAAVPVPVVELRQPSVPPLRVWDERGDETTSSLVLDVNHLAVQQTEANMPWILARAAVRRAVKAVAAKAAQDAAGRNDSGVGLLAGVLTNLVLTAGERAETRNWTSLPAQIQVARLELEAGTRHVSFADGTSLDLRIAAGKPSYVLLLRPDLAQPARVLVDRYTRVPPEPEPAPAP